MELFHILNRGVDKRKIFLDGKDYVRFVHDLYEFNDLQNVHDVGYYASQYLDVRRPDIGVRVARAAKRPRDLLVHIHFFCLMPNHYHLLLSPAVENGISLFMKKLNGGYAKYFNERHERNGALFQGKYKSVPIINEAHFLWIPFYIHFNPFDITMPEWRRGTLKSYKKAMAYLNTYRWSSHLDYYGTKNFPSLTQREFFLDYFGGEKGYSKYLSEMLKDFSFEGREQLMLE